MPTTIQRYGLDKLPAEERLALAQDLWDSVAAEMEGAPLTEPQRAELERRIAEADATPGDGVPWETVLAEARARWRK